MLKSRWITTLVLATAFLFGGARVAFAQNVTSGSIAGTVTDETGAPVEAAQVQVRNTQTGVTMGGLTREGGRYIVNGLEVGGPYTVTVRRIGFAPLVREGLRVTLSQSTRADVQLTRQAAVLTGVRITGAANNAVISSAKTGAGTTISDSLLHRLPTLNRNFQDFVALVPQVSTTTGYLSGGGVNLRQNAIQIDGAAAGDLFGLGTTGQPGSQANAKSIPLESVKEYQVLLSPFDVRQGNFGGLLINAVTRSGTNELHGSAYGYSRTQSMTRTQPYLNEFLQQQYGFTLGGPIVKNHVFFFVNPEWEKYRTPATGPFIGSPDAPVAQSSLDQFSTIASGYGLTAPGTGAQVQKQNPKTNIFGRVDAYLPFGTRLVLRHNYAYADNVSFSRGSPTAANPNFGLTSNAYKFSTKTNSSVAEFLSNFSNGVFNELLFNLTKTQDFRTVPVHFPQLTVKGIPRSDGANGTANFVAGTEASSQGNTLDQRTFEITENLTIPIGDHHITFGTKDQFYKPINLFAQNSLGSWTFNNLTDFQTGTASSYSVSAPAPTDPAHGLATFRANMYAYYVEDVWQTTPNLNLTFGARWDKPHFGDTPPLTQNVLDQYGRNTSAVPTRSQFSPRVAFNWDVTGDQRNQLRGGIGYFSGPPPYVYLSNAFGNSGSSGFVALTCNNTALTNSSTSSLLTPAFNAANIASPPTTCASGTKPNGQTVAGATITGPSAGSAVNTIDPNFRFPQYQKISAAYDHRFANGLVSTVEGLYTKAISNAFYQNIALKGPTGVVDAHGRVLYGNLTATGGTPLTNGSRTQVLDLTNSHGDYIWSLTGTLQKSFAERFEGSLSYTYSQARDVAGITSSTAGSNYRYQRDVTGNLNDMSLTRSKNEQPHHIIATGTYRLPTKTDISFIYQGSSGSPFDYVYGVGSGSGSGDANADGNSQNDLVYVPTDTRDPNQILFTGYNDPTKANQVAAQQAAFDSFINSVPCLKENRGKMLSRNLCHNPWNNEVDISVAQSLEAFNAQNLQLRLDVINFGNLLNPKWGRQFFSDQNSTCGSICSATILLTQTGNRVGTVTNNINNTQGIYTFDTNMRPYSATNASSNYRMQLSLRYSF